MTSSIRNRFNTHRRSGFTLVEMLVVIGIMVVLMGLLLPALNRAYKTSVRDRMAADLQAISTALEAYRQDFDQYPQVYTSGNGANWLYQALIGPGPGFRIHPNGKVWGPYLATDRFKVGDPNAFPPSSGNTSNFCILDRNSKPILYYPGHKGSDITQPQGYLGPNGMFNPNDNSNAVYKMPAATFQILMGDIGSGNGPGTPNGAIDPGETPAYTGNYVLWSAGPDENFGPPDPTQPPSPHNRCDDVANFPRSEY